MEVCHAEEAVELRKTKLPCITVPQKVISRRLDEQSRYSTRTNFERDRDRILYSRPFRRLSGKTQVFLTASHDYIRTRLTHTLEVAQIARDIAGRLQLDQVLAEAIALGHDLGHAPFGHVGERTLNQLMNNCSSVAPCQLNMRTCHKGFKHNLQSLRVAEKLSRLYSGEGGLNLTNVTLWGMANHSGTRWKTCQFFEASGVCRLLPFTSPCATNGGTSVGFYNGSLKLAKAVDERSNSTRPAWSFEGLVVRMADEIAQRHHDIEDALVTRIMSPQEAVDICQELFCSLISGDRYREDRYFFQEMRRYVKSRHRQDQESAFIP
jgi:dGTPase